MEMCVLSLSLNRVYVSPVGRESARVCHVFGDIVPLLKIVMFDPTARYQEEDSRTFYSVIHVGQNGKKVHSDDCSVIIAVAASLLYGGRKWIGIETQFLRYGFLMPHMVSIAKSRNCTR